MARKNIETDYNNVMNIVAEAALNCYGVVSISNKKFDENQSKKQTKGEIAEGIFVKKKAEGAFTVDVYILLAQGIKVTEALRECQKTIKYKLDKKYPKMCQEVNVYVNNISTK